jgi:protein TonB
VAPLETPAEIKPEEGIALGVEGGVPGGVEGGVPGGVVGRIVGGCRRRAPPPAASSCASVDRSRRPSSSRRSIPCIPDLAKQARAALSSSWRRRWMPPDRVQEVRVLRSSPLFDEAAVDAVKQWSYRPLLLNGVPTPFIVTVTLNFHLQSFATGPAS